MTIPTVLRDALHDPAFWARYTFAYEDGPGAERLGDLADETGERLDDEDEDGTPSAARCPPNCAMPRWRCCAGSRRS